MTNQTFIAPYRPYFDSFKVEDNIQKVLFRAGSNFDHSHLNLLQTVLQEQIATFGSHFFKNGSFVTGGKFSRISSAVILDIEDFSPSLDFSSLSGATFIDDSSKEEIVFLSFEKDESFSSSKNKIIVSKENTTFSFPSSGIRRLYSKTNQSLYLDVSLSSSKSFIEFEEGVLFINGYFLYFAPQRTVIPFSSCSIGFELKETIISYIDDSSLLDNAISSPSENSEGADRLKFVLTLKSYPIIEDENFFDIVQKNDFFEYIRIKDNIIVKDVSRPIYSEFEKTLARRTYDESGSYTVNPFLLNIKENNDETFLLELSPGKAYIFGYEFDSLATRRIPLQKSISVTSNLSSSKQWIDFSFVSTTSVQKFIDTQNLEPVIFKNASSLTVGTAKCFYIEKVSSSYRLYFTEILFGNGFTKDDVVSVNNTSNELICSVDEFILSLTVDSFLLDLPSSISSFDAVSVIGQKVFTSVSLNQVYIKEGEETFPSSLDSYFGFDASKNPVSLTSLSLGTNQVSFSSSSPISFLIVDGIIFQEKKIDFSLGEKSITLPFTKEFVITDKIVSLKDILFSSSSILSDFNLEEISSPTFITGTKFSYHGNLTPSGTLTLIYNVGYGFSGEYTTSNSKFDQRKTSYISPPSIKPKSVVSFSYSSSLPRFDKLVLTSAKTFELIVGTPSEKPIPPKDRLDAMTLYTLFIPSSVKLPSSIGIKFHENKRYTMRDIGKLEKRIENLEYYTALNLLETETKNQNFPDQNGNSRFKNGFLVDNFKTYKSVSLDSKDSLFSLDTKKGELRPPFNMSVLDASFSEKDSSAVLTGELVTLPFAEVSLLEQTDASSTINLNPFEVFVWEGKIKLTPETDFWTDTETRPVVNINNFGENDVYQELGEKGFNSQWGSWETQILSVPETETKNSKEVVSFNDIDAKIEKRLWNPSVDPNIDQVTLETYSLWVGSGFTRGFTQKTPDGFVNGQPAILLSFKGKKEISTQNTTTFNESQIKTSSLGSSVVDVALTPFLRERDIRFDVTGLKPSTQFFVLFSDVDVTKLCSMIGSESDLGTIKTNEFGEVSGIFKIPSKQFKNGSHPFKLVDTLSINSSQISSFAVTQYFSKGLTQTNQETFISTREPVVTSQQFTFEKVTAAFDTSVLVKTYKLTLTLEGEGACSVSDWSGVKLTGKSNETVSFLFEEGTDLEFIIKQTNYKYSSQEGLPSVSVGDGRGNWKSNLKMDKDKVVILRFTQQRFLSVKVAVRNPSEGFKKRPYPYYKVKLSTLFDGDYETTLQYKKPIIEEPIVTPTPTPTQTPSSTLSPTPSVTPFETPTQSPTSALGFTSDGSYQKTYSGNSNREEVFCGTILQGWYDYSGVGGQYDVPTTLKGFGGPGLHFRNVYDDMQSISFTTDAIGRPWVRFKVGTSTNSYNVIQFIPYNPIPTPTPTPTITVTSSLSPTPSETPTSTPTQTLTPSPTPTPYITATPSPTLINYPELPFEYSIISESVIETKILTLIEGDTLEASFMNMGEAVTNLNLGKDSSSLTSVNWDSSSDEKSTLIVTEELLDAVGSSTLTLFVTPVDDYRVNIYGRSSGNELSFRYLLSLNSSSDITYSGDFIVSGNASWSQIPSLLERKGKECSFLRLIPNNESTRSSMSKKAAIAFRKDALEPHPQSPMVLIDEVFSGNDSDYKGRPEGILIKFLSPYEGTEIPFIRRGNQFIKELYIDFISDVILPETFTKPSNPLANQPSGGDKVTFSIIVNELDASSIKKSSVSDIFINNVLFSDILKNPSILGFPAKLVSTGIVFEVYKGTKFVISAPYNHSTPSQIFTTISIDFLQAVIAATNQTNTLITNYTSNFLIANSSYKNTKNKYVEETFTDPNLYLKNWTLGLSEEERGTLLTEYVYTDKQIIPSDRISSVITCSKHRLLGIEKTFAVDKTTFASQSMIRFSGETVKLELDYFEGIFKDNLYLNSLKFSEIVGGSFKFPHRFTLLKGATSTFTSSSKSFLLEVPKNTQITFSYNSSSLTNLSKIITTGTGYPQKLQLNSYERDFTSEEKGTFFNEPTNPITERKTTITLSKDRYIKIQTSSTTISSVVYLPPSSSGVDLSSSKVCFVDPLAQSFFIDSKIYPEGVFLSSIDLFFKSKDPSVPVTLEIRPSVNSFPSSKEIIPFSIVTKSPRDIQISENASLPSNFKFPSPVFLKPGEYNFVVLSDSILYNVWVARLGEFKVGSSSEERITKNPYSGVLFKSSNNVAWIPESDTDFTFRIFRCSFKTQTPFDAVIENQKFYSKGTQEETTKNFTSIRTNAVTLLPEKTSFSSSKIILLDQSKKENEITIDMNESKELDQLYLVRDSSFDTEQTKPSVKNVISLFSSKNTVSPVIDTQRLSYVFIENFINKLDEKSLDSEIKPFGGKGKARYITKDVKLNLEIPANKIHISFAASIPKGCQVRTYYKVFNTLFDKSEFSILDKSWIFLGTSSKTASTKDTFIDFELETPNPIPYEGNSEILDFDVFMVKLLLESDNPANVPRIKDFRCIALTE